MPAVNNDSTGRNGGWRSWLYRCDSATFPGCFVKRVLDTSITGKLVGILVTGLFGLTLIIVSNSVTLNRIAVLTGTVRRVSIPQYKVSQYILRSINGFKVSLLQVPLAGDGRSESRHVLANQDRLREMEGMIRVLARGGPVMDYARVSGDTLDIFRVAAPVDAAVRERIRAMEESLSSLRAVHAEFVRALADPASDAETLADIEDDLVEALDGLHARVTAFAMAVNESFSARFRDVAAEIEKSQFRSLVFGAGVAFVLMVATILYILLIVFPHREILDKIRGIARGEEDLTERIEVRTNDEVGQLAAYLNTLVDNIFSLNSFKAVIEEEETTIDVNRRLASLLRERYGFGNFFIYEVAASKNNMTVAYASEYRDICSPDILDDCNYCRAKRTGHPISSVDFPDICKQFPHGDRLLHHCIPMVANNRVVGVVQFLLPKESGDEERANFERTVSRAARYIKEATPVIEAKRFASALQETTLRDPMTDLYNRRFLETYSETLVASTLRRGSKVGILMCDMDFFKEVNDTYGHETGDMVLVRTAEVIVSCVRASDLVIRYGGEEFLVLLVDINSRDDIASLAERIRTTMADTVIKIPDGSLKKTVSIGYSEFPGDTEAFWEAIKFADVALYRAKESGRNRVVGFTRDMWTEEKY